MYKAARKLFFNILFCLVMLTCLFCHDIIVYGTSQGIGQVKLVMNAKPIEEVLKDPAFPDSLKYKLVLITEIKKFAVDSLGINPSDNYSTVYDQKGKPVLWTISASEPYALIAKEWTFPFLGTVSYKGFFNREPLLKEKLELVKSNYDIDIYSPAGWSTLGWFRDPILSNMLLKEEGDLANLIIHELTHGTLFVKDSVTFNENLASFIGDKGAEIFLLNYFGKNSKEYLNYEFHKADELIYNEYILKSTARLDSLYNLMGKGNTEASTKAKKKELITEIALGVNRLHLHNKKRFFKYTLQAFKEGNAFFMAFSRYDSQQDLFEKEYKEKYHSDLKQYLEAMKEKYPSL